MCIRLRILELKILFPFFKILYASKNITCIWYELSKAAESNNRFGLNVTLWCCRWLLADTLHMESEFGIKHRHTHTTQCWANVSKVCRVHFVDIIWLTNTPQRKKERLAVTLDAKILVYHFSLNGRHREKQFKMWFRLKRFFHLSVWRR